MRHFLSSSDLSPDEICRVLDRASSLKGGAESNALASRTAALLFEKPSLRTKLSFMVAAKRLGGDAIYFGGEELGLGTREPVSDVSRVVSRMADVAIVRTFAHSLIEQFAAASSIPVVNALTDREHPCQALADLLTMKEHAGDLGSVRAAYVGDGNNVAASLALTLASVGAHLSLASPEGYEIDGRLMGLASERAQESGGSLRQLQKPEDAVAGANFVYTDVWTSMGQEAEAIERARAFAGYMVTPKLLDLGAPDVRFMHDLPAHPGEEIAPGLLDDPRSIVFDQSENRLWAQAALLELLAVGG